MNRREFISSTAAAAGSAPAEAAGTPVRLGIDLFSIRSQNWTPFQYLDYCARQKAQVVFFSETRFLGSLEDDHLKKVRAKADELGLRLEVGMRSICPTSKMFDPAAGSAEDQLSKTIHVATILGSPIARCVLGSMEDRKGPIPLSGHIENTVKALRAVRSRAMDADVKIAVENHAGDMQADELRALIEEAGKDFVGACLDSGNATWTLEDPHHTLEVLAPYALTTGIRDSAVWRVPEGIAVQWVRMGDGNVGIQKWSERFFQLCPGRTFALEVIVIPPRVFRVFDSKFWIGYEEIPASRFSAFLALADKGKPRPKQPPVPKSLELQQEREDLEASLRFCHETLRL